MARPGKALVTIEMEKEEWAKLKEMAAGLEMATSTYLRLLLRQHIRTPIAIHLETLTKRSA